ncbi:MAG TPA: ATP-binding protein [Pseudonocardiaceae bacterium]|nr:ATP-binding protein [Pseudonocardiaceae bacterium]
MRSEHDGMAVGDGRRALDGATRYHDTRRVLAGVVVSLQFVATPPLAVAIGTGMRLSAYTVPWLAGLIYLVLAAWVAAFVVVVLRRGGVPDWVQAVNVAVVAACALAISAAVHPAFFTEVDGSDLEPFLIVTAVVLGMTAQLRRVVLGCAILAVAHVVAEVPTMTTTHADIASTVTDLCWLAGAAVVSYAIARRLLAAEARTDDATRQVADLHAQVAEARTRSQERLRYLKEQIRRYRALHDGPLSILTAIASGGLDHHDDEVRRQCAINANLLRGLISDDPMSTLSNLSIALTKAGNDYAVHHLRVNYQFFGLPDDLPHAVVDALTGASREALNNIAAHAGTDKAWLTARASGDSAVTVTVVDQGNGFDPATTHQGRGLSDSITGRMADVGGVATVDSMPGQGTRVELRWPA